MADKNGRYPGQAGYDPSSDPFSTTSEAYVWDPTTHSYKPNPSFSGTPTGPGGGQGGGLQTAGEKRANEKYGLGPGGTPASMEWWLDQWNADPTGRAARLNPAWSDYGQAKQQGNQIRDWMINSMQQPQQARQQQQQALGMLWNRAQGNDLISQMMAKQAADRIAAQGMSAARSAPGGYNPMAYRNAQQQAAGAQQQLAGQAMVAGAQEKQAAQEALLKGLENLRTGDLSYTGVLGGIRGQDLALGQQDMTRYGTDLEAYFKDQQMRQDLMKQGMGQVEDTNSIVKAMIAAQADKTFWDKYGKDILAGSASAIAAMMSAFSDVRAKKNIQAGGPSIEEFLGLLEPATYDYKNPSAFGAGPGKHTGVMAQDLEKSQIGQQLVMDTPQGKMVDYGKAMPALLASIVHLNQKQRVLEDAVAGRSKDMGPNFDVSTMDEQGASPSPGAGWRRIKGGWAQDTGPGFDVSKTPWGEQEQRVSLNTSGPRVPPAEVGVQRAPIPSGLLEMMARRR